MRMFDCIHYKECLEKAANENQSMDGCNTACSHYVSENEEMSRASITPERREKIKEMLRSGNTYEKIIFEMKVSAPTITKIKRSMEAEGEVVSKEHAKTRMKRKRKEESEDTQEHVQLILEMFRKKLKEAQALAMVLGLLGYGVKDIKEEINNCLPT